MNLVPGTCTWTSPSPKTPRARRNGPARSLPGCFPCRRWALT